jgi:hypothetical protein
VSVAKVRQFDAANHPTITFKFSQAVLDGEETSMAVKMSSVIQLASRDIDK